MFRVELNRKKISGNVDMGESGIFECQERAYVVQGGGGTEWGVEWLARCWNPTMVLET